VQKLNKQPTKYLCFERIKNFKVKRNPFSMEEGEITPTLKAKQKVIEKKYASVIDQLYLQEVDLI